MEKEISQARLILEHQQLKCFNIFIKYRELEGPNLKKLFYKKHNFHISNWSKVLTDMEKKILPLGFQIEKEPCGNKTLVRLIYSPNNVTYRFIDNTSINIIPLKENITSYERFKIKQFEIIINYHLEKGLLSSIKMVNWRLV